MPHLVLYSFAWDNQPIRVKTWIQELIEPQLKVPASDNTATFFEGIKMIFQLILWRPWRWKSWPTLCSPLYVLSWCVTPSMWANPYPEDTALLAQNNLNRAREESQNIGCGKSVFWANPSWFWSCFLSFEKFTGGSSLICASVDSPYWLTSNYPITIIW